MHIKWGKAVLAGLIGTVVMTMVGLWIAPMVGIPPMNPAEMLAWLLAQLVVIPMMGMPLFSGSMVLATGSLVGHLVYGAVVGTVYGAPASQPAREHATPERTEQIRVHISLCKQCYPQHVFERSFLEALASRRRDHPDPERLRATLLQALRAKRLSTS